MRLCIELQDEEHNTQKQVSDERNLLSDFLPKTDFTVSSMLSSIDLYGGTVFNRIQSKQFLCEWKLPETQATTQELLRLVDDVRKLAEEVRDSVHLYLVFIGG